ncbi:hypothetical protein [Streptomyces sp. IB201691-2A2]|uniref:hypothetical protein n=1 Tax=Streptomyces sp. IB201691-2A2 TaxID=2561920 RepID=UPI00117D5C9B|nr:hypothetical protein [Streptomyces sp. IB201691-2A2]TRO55802.1 hypothetical protein E4K73_49095 [Streptomyces sp. IB201691-2A2]
MARGQDLSNTLTMLHTTVMQTGTNLQDALTKGIGKLEASGQAAQQETSETVVAELSRMRNDLRETKNRLTASRDELSEEVRAAITLLRQEVQKVKDAVHDRSATENDIPALLGKDTGPASSTAALYPGPDSDEAIPASQFLPPAPGAPAEDSGPPPAGALPSLPSPRASTEGEAQPDGFEEQVRQTVHAVLAEEIATLHSLLTGLKVAQDAQTVARDEQDQVLTGIRQELAGLATSVEGWQTQQNTAAQNTDAPGVTKEHSSLLQQAARVSSAILVCHRDTWEFIAAHAGRHPHFRVPPQITDHGAERVSTTLSGRSLIAVLISLYSIKHTAEEGDGDWEMATTIYHRIHHRLTTLASDGEPVTITLDDRSRPSDSADTPDGMTPPDSDQPDDENPEAADGTPPPKPSE